MREGGLREVVAQIAVLSLAQGLRAPEELSRQGASPAQLVREHQLEVFARNFPCWISAFAALYCLLSPAVLGLFVWVCVSFGAELENACDVPLHTWAIVVFASNGYDLVHILLLRYICHHDPTGTQPLPCRVRVYVALVSFLEFGWLGTGLFLTSFAKTCGETSPRLFQSVLVYCAFSIIFDLVVGVNAVGLYTIMNWMLRNGLLSTRDAAPPGTLARLRLVAFDPALQVFQDTPDCCICLAPFDASTEIREAPGCGHVFHGRCLGNWLAVNRTCPLCRRDLAAGPDGESGVPEPSSIIRSAVLGRPIGT